jgi:hypothetical protein
MTKDEALDLALEALEASKYYIHDLEAIVYAADDLGTDEDRAKMQEAITAIKQARSAPVQEPVAQAWDEGYRAGIDDERTSEASIGIAGFDAKVEPARNNPYRTTQPAAQKPWVNLTVDELIDLEHKHRQHENLVRAIESKLKEKNNG